MAFAMSPNGHDFGAEQFDSRDEAIASGEEQGRPFWIGVIEKPRQPDDFFDAEMWLEHVNEQDDYGGEHAEDWDRSTREQHAELESEVKAVMARWLDRHRLRPQFWLVNQIEEFKALGVPTAGSN